jgi:hypothetical protein
MRNAAKVLIASAAALAACGGQQKQQAQNQDMAIEDNLATGQIPPGAEIETLPPDESSDTSSGELAKGDDNPDVNDLNASSNSH